MSNLTAIPRTKNDTDLLRCVLLTGRTDPKYANPKYPACLFQVVQEILDHGELTTEKQRKKLAEYMNKIGLHDIANLLHPSVQDTSRQVSP